MSWSKCFVLLAIFFASSLAKDNEAVSPMKMTGLSVKQGCTTCCPARRNLRRRCRRAILANRAFQRATILFRRSNRTLRMLNDNVTRINRRIASISEDIAEKRVRIIDLEVEISTLPSGDERAPLRAEIRMTRAMIGGLTEDIAELVSQRMERLEEVQTAVSVAREDRQDLRTEENMMNRANVRKTAATERLNRCLGITPAPEPEGTSAPS